MRLARYLASRTARGSLGALLLLVTIYAAIDLVESTSRASIPPTDVIIAYPAKLPAVVSHVLPLALVLGLLLSVGALRRHGEWDALLSAGVSPLRLSLGLLLVPVVAGALAWPLAASWAPAAQARFERQLGGAGPAEPLGVTWSAADGQWLRVDRDAGAQRTLAIERDDDGRARAWKLIEREAQPGNARPALVERRWHAGAGWQRPGPVAPTGAVAASIPTPVGGKEQSLAGATLSQPRLGERIAALEASGHDAAALRAQGALRVAIVAACLLVPLLGLMLVLGGRQARASRLVGIGLGVATGYWLVLAVTWNGALMGAWSAWSVAAGAPLVCVGLVLVVGLRRVRALTPW